jgi:4-hydroxybenzoate polyprenyltransferase
MPVSSPAVPLWRLHLLHSGLPIGAVAAAFIAGTSALLGVPIDAGLLALGFCGTALVYLVDRAADWSPEDAVNRPGQDRWRDQARSLIYGEAAVLALGGTLALTAVRLKTIGAGMAIGLVGALHVLPVLPGGRRLKAWSLWKPLTIGLAWAAGGVLLPRIEAGAPVLSSQSVYLVVYRFLFVAPNVLLADWIDREGDAAAGLTTIGTALSLRTLQIISTVALTVAVGMALRWGGHAGAPEVWIVDAVGPALLLGAVWRLRPSATHRSTLLLDLIVAWPGVTLGVALLP